MNCDARIEPDARESSENAFRAPRRSDRRDWSRPGMPGEWIEGPDTTDVPVREDWVALFLDPSFP
jgi:hypothetical protein